MRVYHEEDPVAIYHGGKGNNLIGKHFVLYMTTIRDGSYEAHKKFLIC